MKRNYKTFLLNRIISNLKIKGFPKILTPHEKFIIVGGLEEYFEKYKKANDNTKGLSETAGSLFVYFAQLPSEGILIKNIFK